MFDMAIKIAADGIDKLRSADVFRVLEQNGNREELAKFISSMRPDLVDEVDECMGELA